MTGHHVIELCENIYSPTAWLPGHVHPVRWIYRSKRGQKENDKYHTVFEMKIKIPPSSWFINWMTGTAQIQFCWRLNDWSKVQSSPFIPGCSVNFHMSRAAPMTSFTIDTENNRVGFHCSLNWHGRIQYCLRHKRSVTSRQRLNYHAIRQRLSKWIPLEFVSIIYRNNKWAGNEKAHALFNKHSLCFYRNQMQYP